MIGVVYNLFDLIWCEFVMDQNGDTTEERKSNHQKQNYVEEISDELKGSNDQKRNFVTEISDKQGGYGFE